MFNVTVKITGICSLVPNDKTGKDFAVCVVLPNAWYDDSQLCDDPEVREMVDGLSTLRPHRPTIRFDAGRPRLGSPDLIGLECVHFLEGQRLTFIPSGSSLPDCSLGNLDGLASFEDVSSASTKHLLSVADSVIDPNLCLVASHVMVRNGVLSCPEGDHVWVFDNYLRSEKPVARKLNHEVTLSLELVNRLVLKLEDMETGAHIKDYVFEDGPDVRITVANLCLHDPLGWTPSRKKNNPVDDEDFRLHYEIVDNRELLKLGLNGHRTPIPRATDLKPNGNGFNCYPKIFAPVSF